MDEFVNVVVDDVPDPDAPHGAGAVVGAEPDPHVVVVGRDFIGQGAKVAGTFPAHHVHIGFRDTNPIRRGQRATRLITLYQRRAAELADLRRAAIEQAHLEHDMTHSEIAEQLGLTKGRITQIRRRCEPSALPDQP